MSVYIYTDTLVQQAKECKMLFCPGDSGEAKCMFCPQCVLSVKEICGNIRMYRNQSTKNIVSPEWRPNELQPLIKKDFKGYYSEL